MSCELEARLCHATSGGASDSGPEAFWTSATAAQDLPAQVPLERWAIERHFSPNVTPGSMYVRHAAFLRDPAAFDAAAFR